MGLFKYLGYVFIALCLYIAFEYFTLPDVAQMEKCFVTSMNKVDLCPKSGNYAKLSQISSNVKDAVIISEDAGFYGHKGVDIDELKNSLEKNIAKGKFARGGSTISQQLAKNLFLSKDKTITRKLKELILTKRIEEKYSKNLILEKYLNVVELGKDIYGVKKASQHYFGKSASDLTPVEGAFIAFLLPSPEKYSVSFKRKELTPFARRRLKDILFKMQYYKKISHDEYVEARALVDSMFKPIPEMEDEPDMNEESYDTDNGVYNLTSEEEIEAQQAESIQMLKESLEPPENAPEDKTEDLSQ